MIRFIFLIFPFLLLANEIKVFGLDSNMSKGIITVKDGMLFKDEMIVSANKIVYNKNKNIILAYGNVYINYDKNDYILSNNVSISIDNSKIQTTPFFLFNYADNSWINSKDATNQNDKYLANEVITSTCNINNPDWKLVSSRVNYDKQTKWIDLYNPVLYLKEVPIFYLPYLGFSLNKTRSSGFLKPIFGYSANEGVLFTLPYYQTLTPLADLEIDPTIRTQRGKGVYSTFRFVHSPTSYGEFKIGYFKDGQKYITKYNLANSIHNGWNFIYENSNIFTKSDKFYVDIKNANDTGYFYLDSYNYKFNTISDKTLTSKINYYTRDDYNYFGVYTKYFKDTTKISNADTMQILPQINYHRFNDNFWNNFSYSIDTNIYNYTREEGYTAIKKSIVIPLKYNINFFEDYLKFGLTEQFNLNQVDMSNSNSSKLTRIDTFIKVYSNLSKNYGNFIHHLAPSVTFGMDNYFDFNNVDSDYINTSLVKKSIAFNLYQTFIANNWNINHKISEVYYLDNVDKDSKYSELLNSIDVKYFDYYLKDNNKYSIKNNAINYNSFTFGFDDNEKKLEFRYIYQKKLENVDKSKTYDINGYWKFDKIHKMFAEYNYDAISNQTNYYIVGISMKKRCWNYKLSYKKEILPLLTNDGVSSIIQNEIYFEIELVPLGGFEQQYQFESKKG